MLQNSLKFLKPSVAYISGGYTGFGVPFLCPFALFRSVKYNHRYEKLYVFYWFSWQSISFFSVPSSPLPLSPSLPISVAVYTMKSKTCIMWHDVQKLNGSKPPDHNNNGASTQPTALQLLERLVVALRF